MKGLKWLPILLLATLLGCATAPDETLNPPGWTRLAPGLLHRELEPGVQALRLDLRQPGLRLRLSAEGDKGRPIDARPDAIAATAAFNAAFFDRQFRSRGHTVSEGRAWAEPLLVDKTPVLVCDARQHCTIDLDPTASQPPNAWTVVGGTPWLIREGRARSAADDQTCVRHCADRHPRTALGLSREGRWLFVLMIEGRRPDRPGMSLQATAQRLLELGAWQGLNLDGGGSSALLLRGVSSMQRPANEPAHRAVSNVLMIEAR